MSSTSRLSIQYSLLSNSQSHLDACPLYPVECPNMCGEMAVPREKVHSNTVEVEYTFMPGAVNSIFRYLEAKFSLILSIVGS